MIHPETDLRDVRCGCLLLDVGVQFVLGVVVLEAIFRASEGSCWSARTLGRLTYESPSTARPPLLLTDGRASNLREAAAVGGLGFEALVEEDDMPRVGGAVVEPDTLFWLYIRTLFDLQRTGPSSSEQPALW